MQSKLEFFYLIDNEDTTEIRNDILECLCITWMYPNVVLYIIKNCKTFFLKPNK